MVVLTLAQIATLRRTFVLTAIAGRSQHGTHGSSDLSGGAACRTCMISIPLGDLSKSVQSSTRKLLVASPGPVT
jgi:hypothetical protein